AVTGGIRRGHCAGRTRGTVLQGDRRSGGWAHRTHPAAPGPRAKTIVGSAPVEGRRAPMNCSDIRPLFHAYLDNELDAARSLEMEKHLAECPKCAAARASMLALRS